MPALSSIALPPTTTAGGMVHDLDLRLAYEKRKNWCWAAVAAGVARFHNNPVKPTRCEVVSNEFGLDCCSNPDLPSCDRVGELGHPLFTAGNLLEQLNRPLAMGEVMAELQRRCPIGIRVLFPGNSGHFLVIVGARPASGGLPDMVRVTDSFFGEASLSYSQLNTDYHSAHWTNSYRTKAA